MESDSNMSSEREREFFGSENEDDMKISHAVGKAGSDEEMIQTGNMCAGADDPGSEETKSVKMKKTPRQPSQREREEHERTHLPFRDWCTHCIKAKSRNDPHKRETDVMKDEEFTDNAISTVSFDYSYFNDKLGKMTKEEYNEALNKGERMNKPMIVIEDRETGAIVAHMCSQKGPGDKWIVRRIGKDLEEMGYGGTRIILKCDQENPIAAVQQEVIKNRPDAATVPRHTAQSESRSRMDVSRTQSEESRSKYARSTTTLSLGTDHPVFEWLVEWAATTLTIFVTRGDGKTSYEKIGGRTRDNLPIATFGERVCYLPLKTNKRDRSKLERLREGIWLVMRLRTNEALIGTPGGVVKTRTIRILPEDEKWSGASILDVKGTPRRPNPLVDDDNVPEEITACTFDLQGQDDHDRRHEERASQEPVLVRMSDIVPRTVTEEAWRSMYVTRRLIAQHGKTPGCPGCENLGEKNGPSHSTECRQRLQNEMSTTREVKIKLDEEQKRRDAFTARRTMAASHTPVAKSPSSSVEHERRAQPSKRARITSEADSSNSTVMRDITTQGPPGADTTSETNMRDSSKRQADVGVEELEQDTNDGGDEAATLGDDVEMGVESQGEQAPGLSGLDVAELKSFPRATQPKVTTESKGSSIMNTASVCPVTGICYDFSELEDRNRAVSRLCSEKPHVLITSPLHSSSSKPVSLNVRSRGTSEREQVTRRAREHLEFICKLIMIQHRNKRYFIHEHPDDTHLWHKREDKGQQRLQLTAVYCNRRRV